MLKSRSEATRQASKISVDDLEAVLVSLKCTVVSIEHEEVGVVEDVEYTWSENKYEPQQQEEYLQALKNEVLHVLLPSLYCLVVAMQMNGCMYLDLPLHMVYHDTYCICIMLSFFFMLQH